MTYLGLAVNTIKAAQRRLVPLLFLLWPAGLRPALVGWLQLLSNAGRLDVVLLGSRVRHTGKLKLLARPLPHGIKIPRQGAEELGIR